MKRKLCLLLVLLFMLSMVGQASAADVLFCWNCGESLPTGSNFCPFCGTAVARSDDSTGSAKPAASAESRSAAASALLAAAAASVAGSASSPAAAASPTTTTGSFNSSLSSPATLRPVRVTKSPTSESVPYGGSCSFIAHAINATSVTWYIASKDGSIVTRAADASGMVSGLYVSGAYSDTLSLSGIPSWMDGCQVQACFTGEGGPVYTDVARIWTYEAKSSSSDEGGTLWWWNLRYNPAYAQYFWMFEHGDPFIGPGPGPVPGPGPAPNPGGINPDPGFNPPGGFPPPGPHSGLPCQSGIAGNP